MTGLIVIKYKKVKMYNQILKIIKIPYKWANIKTKWIVRIICKYRMK
jgi:hypothetical protein